MLYVFICPSSSLLRILVEFVDVYEKCNHLWFGFVVVYGHFVCHGHIVSLWTLQICWVLILVFACAY